MFYYRNGCHLCEELAALLFRGWPAHTESLEWRDVDQDNEWREAYGLKVPVLLLGETEICSLKPDIERITQYFGPSVIPL